MSKAEKIFNELYIEKINPNNTYLEWLMMLKCMVCGERIYIDYTLYKEIRRDYLNE